MRALILPALISAVCSASAYAGQTGVIEKTLTFTPTSSCVNAYYCTYGSNDPQVKDLWSYTIQLASDTQLPAGKTAQAPFSNGSTVSVGLSSPTVASSDWPSFTAVVDFTPGSSGGGGGETIPTKDAVIHHVTFPYSDSESTIDIFHLGTPYANTVIMSNLIGGVMYGHLLHEKYPELQFNKDYLYGTILGQLMQEGGLEDAVINKDFDPDAATQAINNPTTKGIYLSVGQGGPYQINDYAKRLPYNKASDGALGLINYDAVRTTLGYSINDQDSLAQNDKTGPSALDDVYFAPMATAFYHFNDVNRIQTLASNDWYENQQAWNVCFANLQDDSIAKTDANRLTDVVMNVVYNAGSYSSPLKSYLNVCDNMDKNAIAHLNDYSLSPDEYRAALGTTDTGGDTYYRYTRQASFYTDQVYGKDLSSYGLKVTNNVQFSVGDLKPVFVKTFQQLSYKDAKTGDLKLITSAQASDAFVQAKKTLGFPSKKVFDLNNSGQRTKMFKLINAAISNVEQATGAQFSASTAQGDYTALPYDASKTDYKTGDYVYVGEKTNVYQCIEGGWCSQGGAYALDPKGRAWDAAWAVVPTDNK
ncbi:hypothetical protein L4C34_12360 [Vibrio profundum]|uniref:hypothetical protein n=1 Tax=Vibrio profundum TaxID=2910247 RepID=UPI003D12E61D